MFVLLLILIVQAYSEPLDTMLWSYTKKSCQDNCNQYGRGNCDQHQIIQANSPENIQQIIWDRILSLYVCVEYVKGNTVGYVRTGWFEFKCYYIEGITPVVIEPKINEIPIAQAHIIETYPQPTAPQLHIVPTTEKLDIEMGLEDNQK